MRKEKTIEEIIAKNVRERRKELKMTQNELALLLGYSAKAISKWESGMSPILRPRIFRV